MWDVAYLGDGKAGYVHTIAKEIDKDGQKLIHTTVELRLTVKRFTETIQLAMDTGTIETPEGKVTGVFMRQFLDTPGTFPYFCRPDCGLGMTGSVRLTTPIAVQAMDNAGSLTLNWTGGGPTYQIFRSSARNFVSSTVMAPTGGDTGTAFSDPSPVNLGSVNFYLVMNK